MDAAATDGGRFASVDAPALLLDVDALQRNVTAMASRVTDAGLGLRPHAKTHKSPAVARLQLEAGALGIACAKLAEAEALAECGVGPLLVTTEIVDPAKLERLAELARRAELMVVADDVGALERMSRAATAAGSELDVLVDLDVGQGRTGVETPDEAVAVAQRAAALPGLRYRGLQAYEGHLQFVTPEAEREAAVRQVAGRIEVVVEALASSGLAPEIVSTGGTGTFAHHRADGGVTEVQPGSYTVMDACYGGTEGVDFEHALFVLASVVSRRPARSAVTVDVGLKAVTPELGPPLVADRPSATYDFKGDEHGVVSFADGGALPELGERVVLIPGHCDTTVNLFDAYTLVRGDRVVGRWPVHGRGRVQ